MVLSGELAPASGINEQALASRLGVSRGPIREATRGLERSGLLTARSSISACSCAQIQHRRGRARSTTCAPWCSASPAGFWRRTISPEQAPCARGARSPRWTPRSNATTGRATTGSTSISTTPSWISPAHGRARQTYEALIKETHLLRQSALSRDIAHAGIECRAQGHHRGPGERRRAIARGCLREHHAHGGKRRWLAAREQSEAQNST